MKMKIKTQQQSVEFTHAVINGDRQATIFSNKADAEIWEAFRNGHEGAFTLVYEAYFDPLYRYGCHFLSENYQIEDCLQELFMELREKRKKLSPVAYIKPYLFTCFRRKLLRYRLKEKKLMSLLFPEQEAFSLHMEVSPNLTVVDQQLTATQAKYLEQMLNNLPRRQKEVVYHFYFEGFRYQEIAEVMGLKNAKQVRNLLYKALGTLKGSSEQLPVWLVNE
jgi:RNA polymerase sigma factor (sigma-70 family)